jgi:hypothetical protein
MFPTTPESSTVYPSSLDSQTSYLLTPSTASWLAPDDQIPELDLGEVIEEEEEEEEADPLAANGHPSNPNSSNAEWVLVWDAADEENQDEHQNAVSEQAVPSVDEHHVDDHHLALCLCENTQHEMDQDEDEEEEDEEEDEEEEKEEEKKEEGDDDDEEDFYDYDDDEDDEAPLSDAEIYEWLSHVEMPRRQTPIWESRVLHPASVPVFSTPDCMMQEWW